MKKQATIFLISVLFGVLLLPACKKKTSTTSSSSSSGIGTGTVIGSLKFFSETGSQLPVDQTAIVFIPGTNFSTSPNAVGGYTLANVPSGVRHFFVKCNTYNTVNLLNVPVENGTNTYAKAIGMVKTPTWTITALSITDQTSPSLSYDVNFTESNNQGIYRACRVFYSSNAVISAADPSSFKMVDQATLPPGYAIGGPNNPAANLYAAGFSSGQTIYLKAYACAGFFNTVQLPDESQMSFAYTDTITGISLYNGLNLSGAVTNSFICP